MIENTFQEIELSSILKEGFLYSFNPTFLLGLVVFSFLIIRMQKTYRAGDIFSGVLLFSFFNTITFLHLGVSDIIYMFIPEFVNFLHVIRIVISVALLLFGVYLFVKLWQDVATAKELFKKIIYSFLPKESFLSFFSAIGITIKSLCWGVFFGFFCGLWPLSNSMIRIFYAQEFSFSSEFFWQVLLFDLISFWPFLVIFFCITRFFRLESFAQKVRNFRIVLLMLCGILISVGGGTLLYYAKFLS